MVAVRHAFLACPWGFGELCDLVNSMAAAVNSVTELVTNPFLWLVKHLFPPDFLRLLSGQLDQGSAENTYSRLYGGTVPAGVAIAGISATARVTRAMYEDRLTGMHVVVDNLFRFGAGSLILGAPTPAAATGDGMPIGWQFIRMGINAGTAFGRNVVGLLSSPSVFNTDVSTRALVGRFAGLVALSSVPVFGFFFAIILILVGVGILYMAMIMVMRSILLAFAIATAPVCIATAVFDHRNRFFQWWLELFTAGLLIPAVLAFALAITTGFALHFDDPTASFLPITGVLLGGMWFTGKAVHQLTWKHFTHGGITGALTALSTTAMAAPGMASLGSSLMSAAGHAPRSGGALDLLASVYRGGGGAARGAGSPALTSLAGRAGELASAAAAESPLAAAGAAAGADFRAGLGEGLRADGLLGRHFNRAVGAAIGSFAETPQGASTVVAATAGMPDESPMAARVAAYTHQVCADPSQAGVVAGATMGSLMGGTLPDLSRVLSSHLEPEPAA